MPMIETPPPPGNWRLIETIKNVVQTAEFLFKDGTIERGDWRPYHCGSDCPCYDLEDGPDSLFNSYPECWCVWKDGRAIEQDPTYWRPVEP